MKSEIATDAARFFFCDTCRRVGASDVDVSKCLRVAAAPLLKLCGFGGSVIIWLLCRLCGWWDELAHRALQVPLTLILAQARCKQFHLERMVRQDDVTRVRLLNGGMVTASTKRYLASPPHHEPQNFETKQGH